MATNDHTADAVLFLKLEPTWVMIDDVRHLVAAFCASTCAVAERKEQLALAAHELVQNAVAHATSPDIELELHLDPLGDRVVMSVTNTARAEQIEALRERLDRTLGPASARDAYLVAMREAPRAARGGIGLARIRFEAALDLALEVRGEKVTVHAAGRLNPPPWPAGASPFVA